MATTELALSTGAKISISDDREELDAVRLRISDGRNGDGHYVVINLLQVDLDAFKAALAGLPPP